LKEESPSKTATGVSPKKKKLSLTKAEVVSETKETKYECATSIRMKNSYLIKNQNASFEKNYTLIRKKAMDKERTGMMTNNFDEAITKTQGKRPPARDGHTGIVHGTNFYVFGGDRHQMPFNDFHMLDLKSEFETKNYMFK
jgi:hypothetical protein